MKSPFHLRNKLRDLGFPGMFGGNPLQIWDTCPNTMHHHLSKWSGRYGYNQSSTVCYGMFGNRGSK